MTEKRRFLILKVGFEHHNTPYEIRLENDDLIKLVTEYGEASIQFTVIEEYTIVEFSIVSNKDHSVKFYLHFELNDENHAKQLYDEMVETLIGLKEEKLCVFYYHVRQDLQLPCLLII